MKVVMLEEAKGSPNGIDLQVFYKGREYDLNGSLLACFTELGLVKEVKDVIETKVIAPEENAAVQSVPEKKTKKK